MHKPSEHPPSAVLPLMANETLEGWAVLHEIYRVNWKTWREVGESRQKELAREMTEYLSKAEKPSEGGSALFSMLGHKGDLLALHFRPTFDQLHEIQLGIRHLGVFDHLDVTTSYVSVVELGLYEMTVKLHEQFLSEGMTPDSDAWKARWQEEMKQQRERMKARIVGEIPSDRYFCFYPMNKKREPGANWYSTSMAERQRMMRDHGMIGRKYAGRVTQVITGSIGFDDWEWGVYLFAAEPVVFKRLIYEMRFDEASAKYADFGPFYFGLRFSSQHLSDFFSGKAPAQ